MLCTTNRTGGHEPGTAQGSLPPAGDRNRRQLRHTGSAGHRLSSADAQLPSSIGNATAQRVHT